MIVNRVRRKTTGKEVFISDIEIGKDTILEPNCIIYDGCKIGESCIIGTGSILKKGTIIGNHSIFGQLSVTEGNVVIGDWTTIHAQCHLTDGIRIGNRVFIAPFFCGANTPRISRGKDVKFGYPNTTNDPRNAPIIEDGVTIGVACYIAPDVTIGKGSAISMCCLIKKTVPPNTMIRAHTVYPDDFSELF